MADATSRREEVAAKASAPLRPYIIVGLKRALVSANKATPNPLAMGFLTELYYVAVLFWRVFFPRGNFRAEDVPDLRGRIAIVTGAVHSPSCSLERVPDP